MNRSPCKTSQHFDATILDLIPHRSPMLLINQLVEVGTDSAVALVHVDQQAPFFQQGLGIPSWIGLEYMGQTAALIAGQQMQQGKLKPHLGILLGSRKYSSACDYFLAGQSLRIESEETASVGDSLLTFQCTIRCNESDTQLAHANLSVLRNPT